MVLFVLLTRPARLELRTDLPACLNAGEYRAIQMDNPWHSLMDFLVDETTGKVVGIASPVPRNHWQEVQSMIEGLDPQVVRYNSLSSKRDQEMYGYNPDEAHILEIMWTNCPQRTYLPALLYMDLWYVAELAGKRKLIAVGLAGWPQLLEDFNLLPPSSFSIPVV